MNPQTLYPGDLIFLKSRDDHRTYPQKTLTVISINPNGGTTWLMAWRTSSDVITTYVIDDKTTALIDGNIWEIIRSDMSC